MKANRFFAAAMAALTLVGFSACKQRNTPEEENTPLALSETSLTLTVGETHTLTATATVEAWETSNAQVATVADGVVTALAEGNAIISATAKGVTKTCVVLVKSAAGESSKAEVKGSQIWPIILDATTTEANSSKIVANFGPDEVNRFLYVWDNTYVANDNPTGKNFYGNNDGFLAMTVGAAGWSGAGYCLTATGTDWEAAEALRAAIVAEPDSYFLHMAIKSTDNYSHCFYTFGSEAAKFVLGSTSVYDGPVYKDFTRDGSWQEFDIPMSQFATALSATTCAAGVNVFVLLTEGTAGAQINLDAVYFYKK